MIFSENQFLPEKLPETILHGIGQTPGWVLEHVSPEGT